MTKAETERGWGNWLKEEHLESREAQQGVSIEPTKMLRENHLQTFDQRSQRHSETGPTNKNSPVPLSLRSSHALITKGSESLGSRLGQGGWEQRDISLSIRLGQSGTGQIELN